MTRGGTRPYAAQLEVLLGYEGLTLVEAGYGRDSTQWMPPLGHLQQLGDLVPCEHESRGLRDRRIGHDHSQPVESFPGTSPLTRAGKALT